MRSFVAKRRHPRRAGLTLIELVMVLVILAALAGMIVPIVDNIRRSSDKSTASGVMKQALENISLFRIQTGKYPSNFDSLIDNTSGTPEVLASLKDGSANYAIQTLLASEEEGLVKMGIDEVMDHDISAAYRGSPGSSGVVNRDLTKAGGSNLLVVTSADSQGQDIINSVYPPNDLTDQDSDGNTDVAADGTIIISDIDGDVSTTDDQVRARLVVLGIGPNNTAIGRTMQASPTYFGVDGLTQYNRFLALFAVYSGPAKTKRAQLKATLDSAGDFLNQELIEVNENTLE